MSGKVSGKLPDFFCEPPRDQLGSTLSLQSTMGKINFRHIGSDKIFYCVFGFNQTKNWNPLAGASREFFFGLKNLENFPHFKWGQG